MSNLQMQWQTIVGIALLAFAAISWLWGQRSRLSGFRPVGTNTQPAAASDRLEFALKLHALTETARALPDQAMVELLNQVHDRWTMVRVDPPAPTSPVIGTP